MARKLILWHRWLPPRADEPERHEEIAAWERVVAARFTVTGGELLAQLGGTVVAALGPDETADAIDSALSLCLEAEEGGVPVTIALTIGEVSELDGSWVGEAIARAQLLANRARAGEVVLDLAARDRAGPAYLFGRQVSAGAGLSRGITIDRDHPRRRDTTLAIGALSPPVFPPLGDATLDALEAAMTDRSARTFVLRGPVGAGATELIGALGKRMEQARRFFIGASPGGVVPLASLRLALLRRYGAMDVVGEELGEVMARVAAGELVPHETVTEDLHRLLSTDEEGRAWVVLSPCSLIDGATMAAVLAARDAGADFVVVGRLAVDAELPRPLAELDERVIERTIPPLKTADARIVAQAVLGPSTDEEVSKRVAVLGGDTVMGVVEAARTLIATGELVRRGERFDWRVGPREGATSIDTAALLSERLELLDESTRALLEALCVFPDGETRGLLAAVAAKDGLSAAVFDASLSRLHRDFLAKGATRPRPATSLLRWRVRTLIPPDRATELHRLVGEVLLERGAEAGASDALVGYYLTEGGRNEEGTACLKRALRAVIDTGYERSARQIGGWLGASEPAIEAAAGRKSAPPLEPAEQGPPSTEVPLDELLEDGAPPTSAPAELDALEEAEDIPLLEDMEEVALDEDDLELIDDTTQQPLDEIDAPSELDEEVDDLMAQPPPAPDAASSEGRGEALDEAVDDLVGDDLDLDLDSMDAEHGLNPFDEEPEEVDVDVDVEESSVVKSFADLDLSEVQADAGDTSVSQAPQRFGRPAPATEGELPPELRVPSLDRRLRERGTIAPAATAEPPPEVDVPPPRAPAPTAQDLDAPTVDLDIDAETAAPTAQEVEAPEVEQDASPDEDAPEPEPIRVEATSVAPAPMSPFVLEAARALREKRYDDLDGIIERALTDGADEQAVERVRAVAALAKGDVAAARALAATLVSNGASPGARTMLVRALVSLHGGEPVDGIRAGLAALSHARRRSDVRGEAAALHTLAACYRALGRDSEAADLEALRDVG